MKRNVLIGFLATLTFTNLAYADFTWHSTEPNSCEHVSGHWAGVGKASNWFIGDCVYHGAGIVSLLDSSGNFTVEVTAHKDSGSILCPAETKRTLSGVCVNGVTTIMTEYGNMTGSFSQNAGDAKGTLSVAPGINAEVSLQFQRVD